MVSTWEICYFVSNPIRRRKLNILSIMLTWPKYDYYQCWESLVGRRDESLPSVWSSLNKGLQLLKFPSNIEGQAWGDIIDGFLAQGFLALVMQGQIAGFFFLPGFFSGYILLWNFENAVCFFQVLPCVHVLVHVNTV